MNDPVKIMWRLIYSTIAQKPFLSAKDLDLSENALHALYRLSKAHDLAHLVGTALAENHLLPESGALKEQFDRQSVLAIYRYEQMSFERVAISRVLETAKIPFIPLKGAVLQQYYPQPWMRTSGDIDILIHEADLDRAVAALTSELSYGSTGRGSHDIGMTAPSGVRLELHYNLIEEQEGTSAEQLLHDVWKYAQAAPNSVQYHLTDAFFYYYHVAHMAKHFACGGCGIRPLIDLYVLRHCISYDADERERLLVKGELLTFERAAVRLSEVWFADAEPDALTDAMQRFILSGGVYGSAKNRAATHDKSKYLRSRIFLPYRILKEQYPVLRKHKWLLPFMQIRRWFRLLFRGRFRQLTIAAEANSRVDEQQRAETAEMIRQLGL